MCVNVFLAVAALEDVELEELKHAVTDSDHGAEMHVITDLYIIVR